MSCILFKVGSHLNATKEIFSETHEEKIDPVLCDENIENGPTEKDNELQSTFQSSNSTLVPI